MALTKTDGMAYEATPVSKRINGKRAAVKYAQELSSTQLVWLLVCRHKVGLLALGNIVLVLNWAFPEWTEFVKSVI